MPAVTVHDQPVPLQSEVDDISACCLNMRKGLLSAAKKMDEIAS
jgi:hypothetical protein